MKFSKLACFLLLLFVLIRLPGLALPYHQDEWKTARGVELGASGTSGLYHPPLTQLFFQGAGAVFGADHLRLLPLLFGVLSAALLYQVLKKLADEKTALLGLFLYAFSAANVWASLQLDTDGVILPTFFLLTVLVYWRAQVAVGRSRWWWILATIGALLLGLMVKLSFILVIGVILVDFVWRQWSAGHRRPILYALGGLVGLAALFVAGLLVVRALYPAFSISGMISHALSYVRFGGRGYLQIIVQGLKAVMYLSPLGFAAALWARTDVWRKLRIFWLYIVFGFIFYFILFDFSQGALDKYLLFLIVPLVVISSLVLAPVLARHNSKILRRGIGWGTFLAMALIGLNFVSQNLIPLYPKTAWFGEVLSGRWNVLTPFMGGSGPLGYYISFLFIGVSFILVAGLIVLGWFKPQWRLSLAIVLIITSFAYNAIFIEELLFGKINGSAPAVLRQNLAYLAGSPAAAPVLTYGDVGAFELTTMGKYGGRFYAAPQYEEAHQKLFSQFQGDYLVVNLPPLNPDSFYGRFFANCQIRFEAISNKVSGRIYSCPKPKA